MVRIHHGGRRAVTKAWACFIVILFSVSLAAGGQVAGKGSIQGTVTDATGAILPGAAVTLVETSTGTRLDAKSDASGLYAFPNIAVGTYNVTVAAPGFETYEKTGNVLEVGSNISINVSMTVGTQDQRIEVKSEGIALQTEDPAYKQTIDSTQIVEMPLNGRRMTDLLQLAGGINNAGGNDFTGSKYSYAAVSVSVAGGMGNSTLWRLDGGDNGDYMAGANLPFPFPDAVNQFSVEASNLGAQAGSKAGGMVNVVTKSGTNTIHGDAFEFIRNNFIDATNFYVFPCVNGATPPNCGKDTLHQDQYGGTIGGPVVIPRVYHGQDKLFFFAGFQYTRSKSESASTFAYVPTAANLAGDFRVQAGAPGVSAPNPICKTKATQLVDPLTGNIVPGNVYPTTPQWNAQSLALLKYLPPIVPLADGSDVCGHVQYTIPSANFDKQFLTRMDYNVSIKDHLYGRYMLDSYQLPAYFSTTNILLTTANGNPEQRVQTGTIGEDHTFTPSLVNSAHVSLLRRLNLRGYNQSAINACTLGVGITCAVPQGLQLTSGGNIGGFSLGGGSNAVAHFNDNTLAINDDLTWIRGRHQFVFGGEFVRNQLNISNAFQSNGAFSFGSNFSAYGPYGSQNQSALNGNYCTTCSSQPVQYGNGQLDFLQGAMNAYSQTKQQQNALRSVVPSLYAQDTFHVTKRLTMVAGIRWDPFYQPVDVFNRGVNFSFANFLSNTHSAVYTTAPAGMLFYGDPGVLRTFTQSSPNQWDPNVGFIYDLTGDGKTVIRAGGQYMYDLPNNFTTQRNQQNPPFATSVTQSFNSYIPLSTPWSAPSLGAGPGATTPASVLGNPFPTGASFVGTPSPAAAVFPNGGQYIVPVAKFHPAAYAQWTASVQHDFGLGWTMNLQYIGSKGDHEAWGSPLNGSVYIPGISSGTAGPGNCNTTINGTNYYLGEFAASAAVPKAGSPCSATGNESQRSRLILINPTQGSLIGGVNTSVYTNDIAFSTYEGMVLSVNHRLSSTFSLLANYTWSKCLDEADNNGDLAGVSGMNPYNPRQDYGPCGFDFRNVANFVLVVKSAFHFNHRAENLILNNWEFSGNSHLATGSVFSVTTGQDDDLIGNPNGDRASQLPGIPLHARVPFRQSAGASGGQFLNPAAFVTNTASYLTPPTSQVPVYGNTGRNAYTAPGLVNFDAQLSRLWQLHERLNLTTRIEAFNALNHPSFGTPNTNASSGSFGQVSSTANGARVFQGVLKLVF